MKIMIQLANGKQREIETDYITEWEVNCELIQVPNPYPYREIWPKFKPGKKRALIKYNGEILYLTLESLKEVVTIVEEKKAKK